MRILLEAQLEIIPLKAVGKVQQEVLNTEIQDVKTKQIVEQAVVSTNVRKETRSHNSN